MGGQKILLPKPFINEKGLRKIQFTGREDEIKKLKNLLINPQSKSNTNIVVIYGIPGVGKSSLACEFAIEHKDNFPGGIYGVRVDEFKQKKDNLRELAQWFVERFVGKSGGSFDSNDRREPSEIMKECFENSQALLIFDNADLVGKNEDENENEYIYQLFQLFPDNCSIIVTTRPQFVAKLPDWEVPKKNQIELLPFSSDRALAYFKKILDTDPEQCKKIEYQENIAQEIVQELGCLPLAITIVAHTLIRNYHCSLEKYLEDLRSEKVKMLAHRRPISNVWASFSLSIKTLEAKDADFFACLGACAENGFSLSTAMAVSQSREFDARQSLDRLEAMSLINYIEPTKNRQGESHNYRYKMHSLIHEFAQAVLKQEINSVLPEDRPVDISLSISFCEVKKRHAWYFLELVNKKIHIMSEYGQIMEELNLNYDDLIIAAEWLAETENFNDDSYKFILNRVIDSFFYQYRQVGKFLELINLFNKSAANKTPKDYYLLTRLKCLQCKYLKPRGKTSVNEAEEILKNVKLDIEKISDSNHKIFCESLYYKTLSGIYKERKEFDEAKKHLDSAIEHIQKLETNNNNEESFENLDIPILKALCLRVKGVISQRQGELCYEKSEEQEKYFKESIDLEKNTN